jgi:hypothetical protein
MLPAGQVVADCSSVLMCTLCGLNRQILMLQVARIPSFENGITGWLETFLATSCLRVKLFQNMWVLDLQRVQVRLNCIIITSHYLSSCRCITSPVYHKKKSSPITGLDRPTGFQEVEAPRFLDSRHLKVVRLSAVRTGRVYPPGNIPGTHFR